MSDQGQPNETSDSHRVDRRTLVRTVGLAGGITGFEGLISPAAAESGQAGDSAHGGEIGGWEDDELAALLEAVYEEVKHRSEKEYEYTTAQLGIDDAETDEAVDTASLPSIPGMPSLPTSLPFSYCVSIPFGDEICSSVSDAVPTTVDCAPNPVNKVSMEVAKGPNLRVEDGDVEGEISWNVDVWVGFSGNCVYVGQDTGVVETCKPVGCYSWPSPTGSIKDIASEVVDVAEDVVDAIDDHIVNLPSAVEIVLIIVVAAVIAILIAKPPTGVPV